VLLHWCPTQMLLREVMCRQGQQRASKLLLLLPLLQSQ
jgi:hypothetical protein